MGLSIGFSRSVYEPSSKPVHITEVKLVKVPNPDPYNFQIKQALQVGKHVVALVVYPDATSYEGKKILVIPRITLKKLHKLDVLDPHFTSKKGAVAPIARFKPTRKGWELAVRIARHI